MNIRRQKEIAKGCRWNRYQYNLTTNMGQDGSRISGCAEHIALSRKVAGEGMVLLENRGILPLKEGTRVALFGVGTLEYVQVGGGSGQVHPAYVRNVYEGFLEKAPRISIYEPLSRFYYDYAVERIDKLEEKELLAEPAIPAQLLADAAREADVAIIVIHRYSGEDYDRSEKKGE